MATPSAVLSVLVTANTAQANAALGRTQAQLNRTAVAAGRASTAVGSRLSTAARVGAQAAGVTLAYGLFKGAQAGINFEKQLDSLGATTDATAAQMDRLEKQAIRLGQQTAFSANEAARAQTELAKGGVSVKNILSGGLQASLNLAAAGELDLAEAAGLTANALNLFGLEGKQAGRVADVLAVAANTTTSDVSDFALALRQGGSAAKQAGFDLNNTMLALEALALAGIRGSDAGTSLKTSLIQLLAPSTKQAELAEALGISWTNQAGEMKSVVQISEILRRETEGMTQAERTKTFAILAGTDGFRTLAALYDAGPAKLKAMSKANLELGTAQEVADRKMDNLAGDLEQLGGALEAAAIKTMDLLRPALRSLTQEATDTSNEVANILNDDKLSGSDKLAKFIELMAAKATQAIPKIIELGAKLTVALIRGMLGAWSEMNPFEKMLTTAAIIRLVGGKGALGATGRAIGGFLGIGIAQGTTATAAAAMSGNAGAAAGGAGGGILGKLRGSRALRFGAIGVGVTIGDSLITGIGRQMEQNGGDLMSSLDARSFDSRSFVEKTWGQMANLSNLGGVTEQLFSIPGGTTDAERAAERLKEQIDALNKTGVMTRGQRSSLMGMAEAAGLSSDQMRELRKVMAGAAQNESQQLRERFGGIRKQLLSDFPAIKEAGRSNMRSMARSLGLSARQMKEAVLNPTGQMASIVLSYVEAFGKVGAAKYLSAAVARAKMVKERGFNPASNGQHVGGLRTGGLAATVPGVQPGDRHLLALNGVPVARVESGEGIFVGNRTMMSGVAELNAALPRFAKGGRLTAPPSIDSKFSGNAGAFLATGAGATRLTADTGNAAMRAVFEAAQKRQKAKQAARLGVGPGGKLGDGALSWGMVDALADQWGLSPGTLTGRLGQAGSWHGVMGPGGRARATDYSAPMTPAGKKAMRIFATKAARRWGSQILELIYSPLGWSISDGQKVAPYAIADHYDHVHLAFQRGGAIPGLARGGALQAAISGRKAGWRGANLVRAVAEAGGESGWNLGAVGDGGDSHGPWQIHKPSHGWLDTTRAKSDWDYTARAAFRVWDESNRGFDPWHADHTPFAAKAARVVERLAAGNVKDGGKGKKPGKGAKGGKETPLNFAALPIKDAARKKLKQALANHAKLTALADTYADYASRAADFEEPVGGKDEIGWLNAQLVQLLKLREKMLTAHAILLGAIEKLNESLALGIGPIPSEHEDSLPRKQTKRLRAAGWTYSGKKKAWIPPARVGKILETRDKASSLYSSAVAGPLSELQGNVIGIDPYQRVSADQIGKSVPWTAFGGKIGEVASAIKNAGGETEGGGTLSVSDLQELGYLSTLGVKFNPSQFAGFFASGGMLGAGKYGIAGEAGAELISGPAQVTPLAASGGSTVRVVLEDHRTRVYQDEKLIRDVVHEELDSAKAVQDSRYSAGRRPR